MSYHAGDVRVKDRGGMRISLSHTEDGGRVDYLLKIDGIIVLDEGIEFDEFSAALACYEDAMYYCPECGGTGKCSPDCTGDGRCYCDGYGEWKDD